MGSTGIAVRTAADTWAQRTVTGTSNEVDVSNGDGVSGNPTIGLVASPYVTSISFDSGTNFLDFYEEGSWTPTLSGSSAAPTSVTYTHRQGDYTRVGDLCTVSFVVLVSAITLGAGAGDVIISGLPFTAKNTSPLYYNGAAQLGNVNWATSAAYVTSSIINNTAQIAFWESRDNGASALIQLSVVNATDLFRGTITYKVA